MTPSCNPPGAPDTEAAQKGAALRQGGHLDWHGWLMLAERSYIYRVAEHPPH